MNEKLFFYCTESKKKVKSKLILQNGAIWEDMRHWDEINWMKAFWIVGSVSVFLTAGKDAPLFGLHDLKNN